MENYANNHKYESTVYVNSKEDRKLTEEYPWATISYKYENEKLPRLWCKELKIIK